MQINSSNGLFAAPAFQELVSLGGQTDGFAEGCLEIGKHRARGTECAIRGEGGLCPESDVRV